MNWPARATDGGDGERMNLSDVSPLHVQDALTFLCGDLIGFGISRDVYVSALDSTLVIKLQKDAERFQNQREWAVWRAVFDAPGLARWLAPCVHISHGGLWMAQKRTTPVTVERLRREIRRVPRSFTDLKAANWGELDGRLVCHDYGFALTTEFGLDASATKRAEWRD